MKTSYISFSIRCAATICLLAMTVKSEAITEIFNREVEMNDGTSAVGDDNRPFFTIGGPDGYVGTAISGGTDTSSTVNHPNVGLGGNSTFNNVGNGVPLGVGLNFGVSFTVETSDPNHFLSDGGDPGLGINSGVSDTNPNELSAGEQLFFSNIQLTPVPGLSMIHDPLNLLQPDPTFNAQWKALRSATFDAPNDFASTSSDASVTTDVKMFDDVTNSIGNSNNYTPGTFGPLSSVYLTTTGGNWPLKGIRYEVAFEYELAPVPATRRTFQFGEVQDPVTGGIYEGQPSAQLLDTGGDQDTTITISAVGNSALLDTNNIGVGVNSADDDFTLGLPTSDNQQRFINGALTNPDTPEAIHFSFDQDVSFESLTVGNLDFGGTEGVVLSFVSGTNPFAGGLTGYSGDYAAGPDSITFTPTAENQTPYTITYGKNGQDEIIVEAGTVLSVTSNPAVSQGFILDMITVNLLSAPGLLGDYNEDGTVDAADYVVWRRTNINGQQGYDDWRANFGNSSPGGGSGDSLGAVPEPISALLLVFAGAGMTFTVRRKGRIASGRHCSK